MTAGVNKISGFGNPNAKQQFFQHNATGLVTKNFYAFTPVGGDVVFTALNELDIAEAVVQVATAYNTGGTYYENATYYGSFASFNLTSGEILVHLTEQ